MSTYEPILTNPSTRTKKEREKFLSRIDDFATFYWDNVDMFNEFGAFIICEKKGGLSIYNGPSFKNEYSKSQFQNGYTNLSGITFDTQTISFKVGVYWFSIEDYRMLMNFLHPYKIAYLAFGFEQTFGYYCKLSSIKDSSRYIVGQETKTDTTNTNTKMGYSQIYSSDQSGYRYYTELQLTFEVIGTQCAKELTAHIDYAKMTKDAAQNIYKGYVAEKQQSDLDMPIQLTFNNLNTSSDNDLTIKCAASVTYKYKTINGQTEVTEQEVTNTAPLFEIKLKNIKEKNISLKYDSEQGLLYWSTGKKENILSLLSTSDTGARIVDSLDVRQFYWPGTLDHPELKGIEWPSEETMKNCPVKILIEMPTAFYNTELEPTIAYTRQRRTNVL